MHASRRFLCDFLVSNVLRNKEAMWAVGSLLFLLSVLALAICWSKMWSLKRQRDVEKAKMRYLDHSPESVSVAGERSVVLRSSIKNLFRIALSVINYIRKLTCRIIGSICGRIIQKHIQGRRFYITARSDFDSARGPIKNFRCGHFL